MLDRGADVPTSVAAGHVPVAEALVRELPVPEALRSWIAGISVATLDGADGEPRTVVDVPDAATALVVRISADGRRDMMVTGPRRRAMYHAGEPGPACVRLRIQPGRARPLVGRPVRDLVDRLVPIDDLWSEPGDQLALLLSDLADIATDADAGRDPSVLRPLAAPLVDRLAPRTRRERLHGELVHQAIQILASAWPQAAGVEATARRLKISERQLRNLFTQLVGLPPKQFARIDRVRTVLASSPGRGDLGGVAARAGYYDQSHMTAEFRQLMGVPPGAYNAGRLPVPTPCRGLG